MKCRNDVLEAASNAAGKTNTCHLYVLLLSSCLHFIKVSVGWLWEIRYRHRGSSYIQIRPRKAGGECVSDTAESRVAWVTSDELASE